MSIEKHHLAGVFKNKELKWISKEKFGFVKGSALGDGACLYRSIVRAMWFRAYGSVLNDSISVRITDFANWNFKYLDEWIETVLVRWLKWSLHFFASSEIPIESVFATKIETNENQIPNSIVFQTVEELCETWYLTRHSKSNPLGKSNLHCKHSNENQRIVIIPFFTLFQFMKKIQDKWIDYLETCECHFDCDKQAPFITKHFLPELNYLLNPVFTRSQFQTRLVELKGSKEIETQFDLNEMKRQSVKNQLHLFKINKPPQSLTNKELVAMADHLYCSKMDAWGSSDELRILNLFFKLNHWSLKVNLVEMILTPGGVLIPNDFTFAEMKNCLFVVLTTSSGNHYEPLYWMNQNGQSIFLPWWTDSQ